MRIAVISVVHGNLAALEAALFDIRGRKVGTIVNLGDCASGMLWPRETIALLGSSGIVTVRGNHDRLVASSTPETLSEEDSFAISQLQENERAWLGGLPPTVQLESGILLCHGTPEGRHRQSA